MYRADSRNACQVGACSAAGSRGACIGRRTPRASIAATASIVAVIKKQVYGEKTALKTPPSEEPTTVIVPHALPATAFAADRSSGATRFGRAAVAAGE